MDKEQQIYTLKHELAHCYIWQTGMHNVNKFNKEMICDLIASSNTFINEIVDKVKKELG